MQQTEHILPNGMLLSTESQLTDAFNSSWNNQSICQKLTIFINSVVTGSMTFVVKPVIKEYNNTND